MKRRVFERGFKVSAVQRMEAGENVSALARELGVRRKLLYVWRDALLEEARTGVVRRRGRPPGSRSGAPPSGRVSDLASAQSRIAALERKLGQQALELDFFREALQQVEGLRRAEIEPGVTASTRSSGRGCGGKAD